jgi:RNA polymerase sigma-70 factor (ECF subfamily)
MRQAVAMTFADAERAAAASVETQERNAGRVASVAESSLTPQRMDETAFRAFYNEAAPKLRAYIRRASGDAALADDILQETFYRFLRANLPALEKHRMKGYLYRTASSLIVDHWRRLRRERRWSLDSFFRRDAAPPMRPEMKPGSAANSDAMRVFARLAPQERDLLWLAYVEGFDHREIGAALQLAEKSVRVLLFRARKKLAGMLRKEDLGPEELL